MRRWKKRREETRMVVPLPPARDLLGDLEHAQCLFHLVLQLLLRFQEDEELAVVHLQHHSCDLAGQLGLELGDGGEQLLADHLLLNGGRGRRQRRRAQRPARRHGGGTRLRLRRLPLRHALAGARRRRHRRAHHAHARHGAHGAHARHARHHAVTSLARHHAGALAHHAHHLRVHHGPARAHHRRPRAHHRLGRHHAHHLRPTLAHHAHGGHGAGRCTVHLRGRATLAAVLAATTETAALAALGAGHAGHARGGGGVALPEALLPRLPLLGEADVEGLAPDDLEVHLGNRTGGLVGRGETDEAKALAPAPLVGGGGRRGDGAEGLEERAQGSLVGSLPQVLHVEVHPLLPGLFGGGLLAELRCALRLGLRALHVQLTHRVTVGAHLLLLALLLGFFNLLVGAHLLQVQLLDALLRLLSDFKVDEGELAALAVLADGHRGDVSVGTEHLLDLLFIPILGVVFDVEVGVVHDAGPVAIIALDELADIDRLVANLHAVHAFDRLCGRLRCLVVHKAVALRLAPSVRRDLAREDVAEEAEGVIEGLVVDVAVQVLHVDVAVAALPQARVALAPHDAARAVLDAGVVQRVKGALSVRHAMEVHVAIAQGAPRDAVTANTDGGHGAHGVENLVQHGLRDIRVEVANVERGKLRHAAAGRRHAACTMR
mmetsp:Transcript_77772/g.240981  ORF Transcript_77772/g.240981 Transcript_77772/m.240981 type:complete len:661 (-) Transcript_77772:101-2083(-)